MTKPNAKVICHSKAPNGGELTTVEVEFHRFILPELNTHRVFSRNYQSSRAVPVEKMIKQVRNDPALPVHWGKNQRGMVADEHLIGEKLEDSINCWKAAARWAADQAQNMLYYGVHKQITNRLLEPFMWTKGVITATREGWDSFFKLRCHPDAQPEIKLLAERIQEAINESEPNLLNYGDYHLPYALEDISKYEHTVTIEDLIKISTSCCAQVSYRVLDDSLDKALKIYDMLNLPVDGVYPDDPAHFSPTEHVAKVIPSCYEESVSTGNFTGDTFWQYRKALEVGLEDEFMSR